jgi:hypothetical protein
MAPPGPRWCTEQQFATSCAFRSDSYQEVGFPEVMRDGKPAQMTFEVFAERVGKPGTTQIEERIHNPRSGSITISPWCGRRSIFWSMGNRSLRNRPVQSGPFGRKMDDRERFRYRNQDLLRKMKVCASGSAARVESLLPTRSAFVRTHLALFAKRRRRAYVSRY